jgi:hypothetical protein
MMVERRRAKNVRLEMLNRYDMMCEPIEHESQTRSDAAVVDSIDSHVVDTKTRPTEHFSETSETLSR